MTKSTRTGVFGGITVLALAVAVFYIMQAGGRSRVDAVPADASAPPSPELLTLQAQPHIVFRSTARDDSLGRMVVTSMDAPGQPRYTTLLSCERAYIAAGRGVCLAADQWGFNAYLFDGSFRRGRSIPLTGAPSRVRVSRDGRRAAMTVFETGHSYATTGFSTRTTIINAETAEVLGHLEEFAVTRDGAAFKNADFNFWGVTFAKDSNRFYATLDSGGTPYLIEGDVAARTAKVLTTHVECPSLSPDDTRVAFKRRIWGATGMTWQLHVLDLATLKATPLSSETRNVDDQVEWFDEQHVLYGIPEDGIPTIGGINLWVIKSDGSDQPRQLLSQASSPAVVRNPVPAATTE